MCLRAKSNPVDTPRIRVRFRQLIALIALRCVERGDFVNEIAIASYRINTFA
jgi:hypothetical protein